MAINFNWRDGMQLEMRGVNLDLDDKLMGHIERRLRFALGRFAARIERMTVHLSDINGPRGGIDKRCRIAVALVPRGMVMVCGSGDDPFALITHAAKRTRRAVRRMLERRRRGRAPRD
jgi:ribosome-associated translation inhibitor RaiA